MAMGFPVIMSLPPSHLSDGLSSPPDTEYKVGTSRIGNDMAVYVSKGWRDHKFHRYVPLKRRWYHLSSPAERIRRTVTKAEKIAAKLNHDELYIAHEAEIAVRSDDD